MIEILNNASSLFSFYVLRHLTVIILFLIIIDFFWKKQDFKFSYSVIRYVVIISWLTNLCLLLFNFNESFDFLERATGPYWWIFWITLICGFILPALLIHKKLGRNKWILLLICFLSTFRLTFELFVILITSLHMDFLDNSTTRSYLGHLFLRPFIITSFLIGIDVLFFRNRTEKKVSETLNDEVLDGE
ncbi:MAG: hypothetical protein ACI8ZM_000871 [Crocinitomix sp.]|jgi:hypothetical protein